MHYRKELMSFLAFDFLYVVAPTKYFPLNYFV